MGGAAAVTIHSQPIVTKIDKQVFMEYLPIMVLCWSCEETVKDRGTRRNWFDKLERVESRVYNERTVGDRASTPHDGKDLTGRLESERTSYD